MIKKILGILSICLLLLSVSASAQMTNWQMSNYKKLDKQKRKHMKNRDGKRTKQTKTKRVKTFQNRGKSPFGKRHYDVGFVPLDSPKYLALRKREEIEF